MPSRPPNARAKQAKAQRQVDRRRYDRHRRAAKPWRAWYQLPVWTEIKREQLELEPLCQRCSTDGHPIPATVVNHKIPHEGVWSLFVDRRNHESVCKSCHDGKIQAEERKAKREAAQSGASPGAMSRPSWFRRSHIPLTLVCGPPGAGKSTYVRRHAKATDRIICFDEIATAMFGRPGAMRTQASLSVGQVADVLRARNEHLADLMYAKAAAEWSGAWLILLEPNPEHRRWWAETVGAQVVVLETPAAECRARIALDRAAGDQRSEQAEAMVDQWWRSYRPSPLDRQEKTA